MAVLLHEKVVRSMQGKLRRHELADPSVFTEKVDKLMAPGGQAKGKSAGNTSKKTPSKKATPANPRKKAKSV